VLNNILCTTNCKYITAPTLYAVEIFFVSDKYVVLNNLYNNDDNNNNNSTM